LLVDDDADTRRLFGMALKAQGEVVSASSGAEALEYLGREVFDLVLLDLHMPNVDGYAVLDALAEPSSVNKSTPVIVATADSTAEARARALRRRSVYFISKPVPLKVLAELVTETLAKSAARGSRSIKP
jgi:CheY-like chemotaxis protein